MKTSSITILTALLSTGALQAGTTVSGGGTVPPPMNSAPACPNPISYTDIGAVEELPDHIELKGEQHIHYYALEHRGCYGLTHHASLWVYVFVLSERRAVA